MTMFLLTTIYASHDEFTVHELKELFPSYQEKSGDKGLFNCYLKRLPMNEVPIFAEEINVILQEHPQTDRHLLMSELSSIAHADERLQIFKQLKALTQGQPNDDASYTLIELRQMDKPHRQSFVEQTLRLLHTLAKPLEQKEYLGAIMFLLRDGHHSNVEREGIVNRIVAQVHQHSKDMHYGFNDLIEMLKTKGALGYFMKKKEHALHVHHQAKHL